MGSKPPQFLHLYPAIFNRIPRQFSTPYPAIFAGDSVSEAVNFNSISRRSARAHDPLHDGEQLSTATATGKHTPSRRAQRRQRAQAALCVMHARALTPWL